jgi:hypothetical protein
MKKLLLIGLLVATTTTALAENRYIETRVGLVGMGSYNYDSSDAVTKEKTKGVGVDFSLELMNEVTPGLYLGAGVAYQVNQENKRAENPLFTSIPVYGAVKYSLGYIADSSWESYIKGNLGYSFNSKDGGKHTPKDGLYWALGGGIENDGVLLEISYQDTYSEVNHTNYNYSRWTFGIGYRFRNL